MFSGTVEIYLIFGEMRLILLQEWEAAEKAVKPIFLKKQRITCKALQISLTEEKLNLKVKGIGQLFFLKK